MPLARLTALLAPYSVTAASGVPRMTYGHASRLDRIVKGHGR